MICAMEKNKAGKRLDVLTGEERAASFNSVTKKGLPEEVTCGQNLEMREQAHRYWGRGSV